MKILVPSDFSENAKKALSYAASFAKKFDAEIILFHTTHIPVIAPGAPLPVYDKLVESAIENSNEALKTLWQEISQANQQTKVKFVVKIGLAGDEITAYAEEESCDLIIMGTAGASGIKKLWGSIASGVVVNSKCPVIAVPFNYMGEPTISKIVLATDFKENATRAKFVAKIASAYKSDVMIFHVHADSQMIPTFEQAEAGLILENQLEGINHSYHFSEDDDVAASINEFAYRNEADLLVLYPSKKSFLEKLFGPAITNEIAQSATIPVLVIPSK
jgi:nucleotide-binding universal stress UspA family protein